MKTIEYQDLCFLTIKDLKKIACLFTSAKFRLKADIIGAIITFMEKNNYKVEKLPNAQSFNIPIESTYFKDPALNCHMIQGQYKQCKKNRFFFKKYIGESFKFSALTNDWLKYRWKQNKAPTYGEFITFWKENHHKKYLREELAYNSFFSKNSGQTAEKLKLVWHKQKEEKIDKLKKIMQKIIDNTNSYVE